MKNEKLSQALKNYWRTLKYEDPQKYNERVNQLKEANKAWRENKNNEAKFDDYTADDFEDTSFADYSEDDNDDIDEEEYNDFEDMSQNFEDNKMKYEDEIDEKYGVYKDETFIYNYFKEAYEHPDRKGSQFILEWIEYIKGRFKDGEEKLSYLILEAAQNGKYLTRTETYELQEAVNFCNALLDMWYRDGLLEEVFDNREDLTDFMKATANAIVSYINADEEFKYYD